MENQIIIQNDDDDLIRFGSETPSNNSLVRSDSNTLQNVVPQKTTFSGFGQWIEEHPEVLSTAILFLAAVAVGFALRGKFK